jgi:hypothetical protein
MRRLTAPWLATTANDMAMARCGAINRNASPHDTFAFGVSAGGAGTISVASPLPPSSRPSRLTPAQPGRTVSRSSIDRQYTVGTGFQTAVDVQQVTARASRCRFTN